MLYLNWLVVTSFGTKIFGFVFFIITVSAFIDFMVEKRVKIEVNDVCQNIGKKNGTIVRVRYS